MFAHRPYTHKSILLDMESAACVSPPAGAEGRGPLSESCVVFSGERRPDAHARGAPCFFVLMGGK